MVIQCLPIVQQTRKHFNSVALKLSILFQQLHFLYLFKYFYKACSLFFKAYALFFKEHSLFFKEHSLFFKAHSLFFKAHSLFLITRYSYYLHVGFRSVAPVECMQPFASIRHLMLEFGVVSGHLHICTSTWFVTMSASKNAKEEFY